MNTRKHKKSSKRILLTVLALMLVMCMGIAGTMAYLTAKQNDPVVNTFVAAGGGNIIEPNPEETAPEVTTPDGTEVDLTDGFYLVESKVEYKDNKYSLHATEKAIANSYNLVTPGMELPKDPTLTVDIATGAQVYIFVKVENTLNSALTHSINATDWTEVTGESLSLGTNEKLYCYKNAVQTGVDKNDITSKILTDDKITIAADATLPTAENGKLGDLKFTAYICQAGGFDSAAAAYTACFVTTTTD